MIIQEQGSTLRLHLVLFYSLVLLESEPEIRRNKLWIIKE